VLDETRGKGPQTNGMELTQPKIGFRYRRDLSYILAIILIAFAIYYPIFYSEYLYTDEAVQLWRYRKGSGVHMSIVHGRYLFDQLTTWLFSNANTIHDLISIRIFSFLGWVLCLPAWYLVIKKVITREKLPQSLVFFSTLYLVCTPSFSIQVSWATLVGLFIANTSGLLSGYFLYAAMNFENQKIQRPVITIGISILFGVISLFTYQNGFGCFLLPFLLHLISRPRSFRILFIAIGICLLIYVIYYFLFKYSLAANHTQAIERTQISLNIFPKIRFFARPLATAFHFTFLFNERSIAGFVIYAITLFTWLYLYQSSLHFVIIDRLKVIALVILVLLVIYLPTLIVKENYFPNRTLLALDMAVFFLVASTVFTVIKKHGRQLTILSTLSFLFILNARHNLVQQFLAPLKIEYKQVRSFIESNYNPKIAQVYFIRPREDFFVRKYNITRTWDEFGVPSTFFDWVPEFFTKQVVFEKTNNRKIADTLVIQHWLGKEEYAKAHPLLSPNTMLVDVEEIMNH
jgi:hypothetical protein